MYFNSIDHRSIILFILWVFENKFLSMNKLIINMIIIKRPIITLNIIKKNVYIFENRPFITHVYGET